MLLSADKFRKIGLYKNYNLLQYRVYLVIYFLYIGVLQRELRQKKTGISNPIHITKDNIIYIRK